MNQFPISGDSIFSTMSRLAAQYGAVNLSQGFPNFPVDPALTGILARKAKENVHQYVPSTGYPPLLEKIASVIHKTYGRNTSPHTELLVTAGATQAIFTAISALVESGDEVMVLDPAYDCYDTPILLAGAKPLHIPLGDDFRPDWNAVENAVSLRTKMIVINNPHNPSGTVWAESDFEALETLVEKFPRLLVLSDEVYEFITFEKPHISVNGREKLRERSLVVSSFGKTFHITGWKIGYLCAPEYLMKPVKNIHQFLVFCVNSVAQATIADYLELADLAGLRTFYRARRDRFRALLQESDFGLLPCEGTYFQVASFHNFSDLRDTDFVLKLVESGVAAIPLSVFNQSGKDVGLIRFCFAKDDQTLEEAAARLRQFSAR